MRPKILVVEDEPDAMELIAFNLESAGFDVRMATDGKQAIAKAQSFLPDLIVLDLMLPEVDGFEVCKVLRRDRATTSIPVVMLTAKGEEIDRILGFELGADDYVTKPFSPRELVLRIKRLLKSGHAEPEPELIQVGTMRIDIPRHQVTVNETTIELTRTEFKILQLLAERRGRVQSRERLLEGIWGHDSFVDIRTVDTHVRRLREKLGLAAAYIDTVRGVGYRLIEV